MALVESGASHELSAYQLECERRGVVDVASLIQNPVWEPRYGEYDRDNQLVKLDMLVGLVRMFDEGRHSDSPEFRTDIEKTANFINHSFDMYEGKEAPADQGSFGFVVPTRVNRMDWDYSQEVDDHFPILKYVDVATRQLMLVGMCPFVIDTYGKSPDGKRGYMIFAPLFENMIKGSEADPNKGDIANGMEMIGVLDKVINDTARFAKERLGIPVIGLGAILPRITDFGRMIKEDIGVYTTTGHAGTVALIGETLKRADREGYVKGGLEKVGFIGSGAIGMATAEMFLREGTNSITISDRDKGRLGGVVATLQELYPNAKIVGTLDNAEVLANNNAVVSAITTKLNLDDAPYKHIDLDGKLILDDSQPGCFEPEELEARGANLVWPIGTDGTVGGYVTRGIFDYQGTGPASRSDVWGCEAEVAAIAFTGEYSKRLTDQATPEDAFAIKALCDQVDLRVARLQRMGTYLEDIKNPVA